MLYHNWVKYWAFYLTTNATLRPYHTDFYRRLAYVSDGLPQAFCVRMTQTSTGDSDRLLWSADIRTRTYIVSGCVHQGRRECYPIAGGPSLPGILPITISVAGVTELLLKLKARKVSDPANIPARVLKGLAEPLSPCLSAFFPLSLQRGEVPMDWKNAFVAPIFKNYRHVSLTCICWKIIEHIVWRHVLNHLESHRILCDLQHGFRHGHACETQLLITFQDTMSHYNKKNQIDIAVLDFAKAFDTVPHKWLLDKLRHYGVNNNLLSWISSFSRGRK